MPFFFYSALGYCTGALGLFTGGVLSVLASRLDKKNSGLLLAFTAGLLLAFVCFEMLPHAFAESLYLGIAVLAIGALAAIGLESAGRRRHSRGLFLPVLGLGLALHKLPEGLALGSLLCANFTAGLSLAFVIAIHCIPEGLALTLVLNQSGMKYGKIMFCLLLLGLPMAVGAGAGSVLGLISPCFQTISLGFAGGIMIYLTCGEILPEAAESGGSLFTALSAAAGFLAGIYFTSPL